MWPIYGHDCGKKEIRGCISRVLELTDQNRRVNFDTHEDASVSVDSPDVYYGILRDGVYTLNM
jgi:hypothetical protein